MCRTEHFRTDVAIRVAHLEDSTLVARKLADSSRVLVAAPGYLQRHGTPTTPEDLAQHACLVYTSGARSFDEWGFIKDGQTTVVKVQGKIQINDGMSIVAAACADGGISLMDRLMVTQELASGELVEIMRDYGLRPGQSMYAVYPARPWLALKTATFVAFLQERLFAQ